MSASGLSRRWVRPIGTLFQSNTRIRQRPTNWLMSQGTRSFSSQMEPNAKVEAIGGVTNVEQVTNQEVTDQIMNQEATVQDVNQEAIENVPRREPSWLSLGDTVKNKVADVLLDRLNWTVLHKSQVEVENYSRRNFRGRAEEALQSVVNIPARDRVSVMSTSEDGVAPETIYTLRFSELMPRWYSGIVTEIEKEQSRYLHGKRDSTLRGYGAQLAAVPPDVAALISLQGVMQHIVATPHGVPLVTVASDLGKEMQAEANSVLYDQSLARENDNHGALSQIENVTKSNDEDDENEAVESNDVAEAAVSDNENSDVDDPESNSTETTVTQELLDAWDARVSVKLGTYLVSVVLETCTIPIMRKYGDTDATAEEPAFTHTQFYQPPKTIGAIAPHRMLRNKLSGVDPIPHEFVKTTMMYPLVFPPIPWGKKYKGNNDLGGYITQKSDFIRGPRSDVARGMLRVSNSSEAAQLYEGVNAMGNVPWKINKVVFEVAKRSETERLRLGGMVPYRDAVADPAFEQPFILPPKPVYEPSTPKHEWRRTLEMWTAQQQKVTQVARSYMTKRMEINLKLSTAEMYLDVPRFWYPYTCDFRGRVYPVPFSLNHMGDDLSRALLTFATPKKLTKSGLFWLKVHLANLMGNDKVSLEDRVAWVDDHMDQVLDSAAEPIDTEDKFRQKWWNTADSPFQALAAIVELANAVNSGDPENYMCSLPIHQDGSCNGLQHYAALGRDREGGSQVNLVNNDKPGDVYTAVANLVKEMLEEEAANWISGPASKSKPEEHEGDESLRDLIDMDILKLDAEGIQNSTKGKKSTASNIPWEDEDPIGFHDPDDENSNQERQTDRYKKHRGELAHMLKDRITRKLVKQTVMTSVYGVTFIGARQQIAGQLSDMNEANEAKRQMGLEHDPIFDEWALYDASVYLAYLTLKAIETKFVGASTIKKWLQQCARIISFSGDQVKWITPLGLPVIQPYDKRRSVQVRTVMQKLQIMHHEEGTSMEKMESDFRKQQTAFPPNYVHSLDASHLLLTAITCTRQGMDFTAVHDSFWTHACDIESMNEILRDEFINLHGQDLLGGLVEEFHMMYPQLQFPPPPETGDLDLEEVRSARYFFN